MANLQDLRAKNNPQFSYMYEVDITGSNFSSNDITLFAKTVTIPQTAVEQMVINHKAGKSHYATRDAAGHTFTMTFWDDELNTVRRFFDDWMKTIQNPNTMSGTGRNNYSADVNIRMKDASDEKETAVVTLSNCFITDISDISLSYDSNEAIEVSVTLSYDKKEVSYK